MKIRTTKKKTTLYLCACMMLGGASFAADAAPLDNLSRQWYVGGSLGLSSMDPDGGDTWETTDKNDIAKKIYVGTDISRQFGLEAFWADFGDAELKSRTNAKGKVNYTAIGANVVYNSPVKFAGFRPLGKLGIAKFKNKDEGDVTSKQNNKLTVFAGVGAEYDLPNNLTLRTEYEFYDKDISQFNVGLNWSPQYRDHSFISQQNTVPVARKAVRKEPNIINVYVPPQPVQKPIIIKQKPRVVYKPAPRPAAPQYKVIHRTLSGGSHFATGSAQLTLDGRQSLDRLANDLRNQVTIQSIQVIGHTDSVGSEQSNLSLSYARANSVAAYLASRGVNRQLITTRGLGETRPIADNNTNHGRALNRRVEITVKGATRIRVR